MWMTSEALSLLINFLEGWPLATPTTGWGQVLIVILVRLYGTFPAAALLVGPRLPCVKGRQGICPQGGKHRGGYLHLR